MLALTRDLAAGGALCGTDCMLKPLGPGQLILLTIGRECY
jgi:hypothetical protein